MTEWIQWEGELREGCRYPTEDEIRAELGWSEDDEAAHLEVFKEIAVKHGLSIIGLDWKPQIKSDGDE